MQDGFYMAVWQSLDAVKNVTTFSSIFISPPTEHTAPTRPQTQVRSPQDIHGRSWIQRFRWRCSKVRHLFLSHELSHLPSLQAFVALLKCVNSKCCFCHYPCNHIDNKTTVLIVAVGYCLLSPDRMLCQRVSGSKIQWFWQRCSLSFFISSVFVNEWHRVKSVVIGWLSVAVPPL